MIAIPPLPPARGFEGDESLGRAEIAPRYEDVTQDGRVVLTSLMPGVGLAVWRNLIYRLPAIEAFRAQGVLPILRRVAIVEGERGPFSAQVPIAYEGTWRLAREKDGDRLFVNMWVSAFAPVAHTLGPEPLRDAPRVLVGRIFAEHVVTRPFASPDERKVTRLAVPGLPEVPEDVHAFESGEALLGGRALEPVGERDEVRFGLMHTDSNQHVNSLVYPRMFEELALRRHGDATLLARALEMRWRKPFFAGDVAKVAAAFDGSTVVGTFAPAAMPERASCVIAMTLR